LDFWASRRPYSQRRYDIRRKFLPKYFAENLACFRSPILHYNAIDTTSGWYFIIVNEINVKYITK